MMTNEKAQHARRSLGEGGTKKIHVDLPEHVHQQVRVKAALEDVSMQALVAGIVTVAVANIVLPKIGQRKRR